MKHETTCICAWCLKERNETPKEEDSHGICTRHYEQMMKEAEVSREARREARKDKR